MEVVVLLLRGCQLIAGCVALFAAGAVVYCMWDDLHSRSR